MQYNAFAMVRISSDTGPDGSLSEQVLIAMRRIVRAIDLHSRTLAKRCGLTGPQLIALKKLRDHDPRPLAIGCLAREIQLSQATVTGILTRLEARGLVHRARSQTDRRQVMVTLTPAAHQLLDQAPPLLQDQFLDAFTRAKDWEQHQILASLQRVVEMMEVQNLDATPMLQAGPIDTPVNEPNEPNDLNQPMESMLDQAIHTPASTTNTI